MARIAGPESPIVYKEFSSALCTGTLYHSRAKDLLTSVESSSVELVFLDPPFNLGKLYSGDAPGLDARETGEYENWMKEILDLALDVLAPGGSLYLYHLPEWAIRFGAYLDGSLQFRHWIAVSMKNGFARGDRLYPAHYGLLYFTKGEPRYFSRPRIKPSVCRHCGRNIKDYGGYKSIIEEKGINLSDVWEDLSPVRHANRKLRPQNQLPLKMLERVIEISGKKGFKYLDPFAGTGTGVIAAIKGGLSFIAGDIVEANCKLTQERVERLLEERKEDD